MAELDESFQALLGRAPSDEERQQLFRVRDALGLRPNDAIWQILIALEFYQRQYERFPTEISRACQTAVAEFKSAASEAAKAATAESRKELAKTVREMATASARGATWKQLVQWCLLAVIVVGALVTGGALWAFQLGRKTGLPGGDWSATVDGQLAHGLAQVGSLRTLARCEGPGWEIREGKCFPQPLDGQVYK